ncbi:hypothetical protein [Streptomyces nigrescens]|uniref:hypothetical protein n=1 Tax=Streptomyces nigrescens TaxID=1920 RepID=UPI0036BCEAB3
MISGGLGTWDSNGRASFGLSHLDGPPYRYHVHAQWSETKKAVVITALSVEPKNEVEDEGISSFRTVPMDQIRHHADTILGSPWSGRSHIALMKEELAELPTHRRQASPHRYLVAAWIAQNAERERAQDPTQPTPNEAVRRFFGFPPKSKANVTKLLNEGREQGLFPSRTETTGQPVLAHQRGRTETMEMVHQRVFLAVLNDFIAQGGEVGRRAAALLHELDAAAGEQSATMTINLDAVRARFPTEPIGGDPDGYRPLPLQAHSMRNYQRAFDRLAVSHRNEPRAEIIRALREVSGEGKHFGLSFSEESLQQQATAIIERRTIELALEDSPDLPGSGNASST